MKILSLRAYTHSLSTKTESQKPDLAGLSARQSTDTNAILSVRAHVPSLPQKVKDQQKAYTQEPLRVGAHATLTPTKSQRPKKTKKTYPNPCPPAHAQAMINLQSVKMEDINLIPATETRGALATQLVCVWRDPLHLLALPYIFFPPTSLWPVLTSLCTRTRSHSHRHTLQPPRGM